MRMLFDEFNATDTDQYVRDGRVCGDISMTGGTSFPVITENDMTTMTPTNLNQGMVLGESSRIIPRKVSFLGWVNMDHPESFGTHYRNRTLTLSVNGLSLEKSWFDPRKVWDYCGMMILIFRYSLRLSIIFLLKWLELGTKSIRGDFNEILVAAEKEGRSACHLW
ncbi:hypothetical protein TB2_029586 [Malus domestica]